MESPEQKPRRLQVDLLAKLEAYQSSKGLSRKSLARQLGVSIDTISQWLERHRKLRPRECENVEKFLKRQG